VRRLLDPFGITRAGAGLLVWGLRLSGSLLDDIAETVEAVLHLQREREEELGEELTREAPAPPTPLPPRRPQAYEEREPRVPPPPVAPPTVGTPTPTPTRTPTPTPTRTPTPTPTPTKAPTPRPGPTPRRPPAPTPGRSEPEPPAAPAAAHVDEEAVVVAEFAEEGAEEGAGAQVSIEEPWSGYGRMRAAEIVDRLVAESESTLSLILLYEDAHRRRRSVLDAARRELARRTHTAAG
jgi:outer membrane biosynthesis protein TonB